MKSDTEIFMVWSWGIRIGAIKAVYGLLILAIFQDVL